MSDKPQDKAEARARKNFWGKKRDKPNAEAAPVSEVVAPLAAEYTVRVPVERIREGYIALDQHFRVIQFNPAAAQLLGRSPESVLGQELFEAFPEARGSVFEESYRRVHRTQQAEIFETYFDAAPYANWYAVRVFPEVFGISVFFHVTTESVQTARALQASEDKFQRAFLVSPDIMGISTIATGEYVEVNEGFLSRLGFTRDEVIGRTSTELGLWLEPSTREHFIEMLKREGQVRNYEVDIRAKSGTVISTLISASSIDYQDQQCALVVARDVTERKAAVDSLHSAYDALAIANRQLQAEISERREAEQALRDSEQRFRLLAERATDIVFRIRLKPRLRFEYVSPASTSVIGYTPEEHYADPDLGIKLVHPEDREQLQQLSTLTPEELTKPLILRWVHKTGAVIWIEQRLVPIMDANGVMIAMHGIARDITDRVRIEQQLRENEQKLRILFNSSAVAFMVLGDRFTDVNETAAQLFGGTREQLIGMRPAQLSPPNQPDGRTSDEAAQSHIEKALAGEPQYFRWVHRRLSGENFDAEVTLNVLPFDGAPHLFATVKDVSAHMRAEQAIRHSEERLHSLYDHMAEGVALHELVLNAAGEPIDYRLVDVNPRYEEIVRLKKTEIAGRLASEIYASPAPYLDIYKSVALTRIPQRFEIYYPPIEGYLDISVVPWGEQGFATIFTDITRRRVAEAKLQETIDLLYESQRVANLGTYVFYAQRGDWTSSEVLDSIFGITEGSFNKDVPGWLSTIHPDDRQLMQDYLQTYVVKEQNVFDREYRIIRQSDQQERWVHGHGRLLMTPDGTVELMVGTIQDITERKLAELELVDLSKRLQLANEQHIVLNEELASTNEELTAANAELAKTNEELQITNSALELSRRQLSDAKEYAETLIETAHVIIVGLDQQGCVVLANQALQDVLGTSKEQLLGQDWFTAVVPEEHRHAARAALQQAVSKPRSHGLRFRSPIVTQRGDLRMIEWSASSISTSSTTGDSILYGLDVTDLARLQAERDRLFNFSIDMFCVADFHGGLKQINPAWHATLGWSEEELLSRSWSESIHPQDRDTAMAALEKLSAGEVVIGLENRFVCKDGSCKFLSWNVYPYLAEGLILAVARDVTEAKAAERAVHESERQLASLMSSLPGMAYRCMNNPDWTFEYVSEGCLQLTGYKPGELLKSNRIAYAELIVEADREAVWTAVQLAVNKHEQFELQYRISTADGTIKWVWERGQGVFSGSGDLLFLEGLIVDRTQQKIAELALALSEQYKRAVIENSPLGISVRDANGQLIEYNEAWRRIWAIPDSELLLDLHRERHGLEFDVRDSYLGDWIDEVRRVYREGGSLFIPELELQRRRPSAATWIAHYFYALHSPQGEVSRVVIITQDISSRKESEFVLAQRETLEKELNYISTEVMNSSADKLDETIGMALERISNHCAAGIAFICQFDESTAAMTCSHEWCADISKAGKSHQNFSVDQAAHWYQQLLQHDIIHLTQVGTADLQGLPEWIAQEHSGAQELLLVPMHYASELRGFIGFVSDSSQRRWSADVIRIMRILADLLAGAFERRRYEAELSRLATAVFQSAESIMITDAAGYILYVNPAFERISGYSAQEAIGQHTRLLKSGKHDQSFYRELWKTVLAGKVWRGRLSNRRMDGRLYEQETAIAPIIDDNGQISSFVAINRDITREVELELQMRQLQKLEAIGTLAGGVAHDFNNILFAILGCATLIGDDLEPGSEAQINLNHLIAAANRARGLVQQILAFSRQSKPEQSHVNIANMLSEVYKLLRATVPATIDIQCSIQCENQLVLGDPAELHQVLMNLATNATQAMEDRSGIMGLELREVDADEEVASRFINMQPGKYLVIAVSDTGPGIPQEIRERMFEPFFTTKEPGRGTGMGLAVVHGIVIRLGGAIQVESEINCGTRISVYLPVAHSDAVGEGGQAESIPHGSEHILVVDDELLIVRATSKILTSLGYRVSTATNGAEALEIFRRDPAAVDLVLTDQLMPHMTGAELASHMLSIRPELPIIMFTGFSRSLPAEYAKALGIREYVYKPLMKAELAAVIRRVLDSEADQS